MNKNTANYEIKLISQYKGLLFQKYYVIITTVIGAITQALFKYPSSSIYILMVSLIMPGIFSYYAKTNNAHYTISLLTTLKKKYRYNESSHRGNWYASFLYSILLALWQISNVMHTLNKPFPLYYPGFILVSCLCLRFIVQSFYLYKFHKDLWNNKM